MKVRRRRRTSVLVLVLAIAAAASWFLLKPGPKAVAATCTATVGQTSYSIDPEQASNATTIGAEAHRQGLPAHAVSVGLAAAFQESKLRNLNYGDRDSLGLFQQRPSQGWGTPSQILQPTYAAAAFFRELSKVEGWQGLPIHEAAQRVQRSADGSAYAAWDTISRTFAQGLTGQAPGGFTCSYPSIPRSTATTQQLLATQAAAALGPGALSPDVSGSYGWLVASWLITRAPSYSLEKVSFAGWSWTPHAKTWIRDPHTQPGGVSYSMRPIS